MRLPNFLIIGAQKSGTTWLGRMLNQHPEIFVYGKEIHFFDRQLNFEKGIEWYKGHFEENCQKQFVGEKTPDYLWAKGKGVEGHLSEVHKNIYQYLPDAKLILILRNPVERAISAIHHIVRTKRISPLSLLNFDRLLVPNDQFNLDVYGVWGKGRYYDQIHAFEEYFDPSQILILIYEEDVVGNPAQGIEKVCRFLGAKPGFQFQGYENPIDPYSRSLVREILDYYCPRLNGMAKRIDRFIPPKKVRPSFKGLRSLYRWYEEPNQRLFQFLGREIPAWKMPEVEIEKDVNHGLFLRGIDSIKSLK